MTLRARVVLALLATAACVTAAGCTTTTFGRGKLPSTMASTMVSSAAPRSTTPRAQNTACPSSYAAPDPNRPRMALDFVVDRSLRTVRGTENIVFRPDAPVTELIFRLTANTAPTVAEGNKIVVTSATANPGGRRYTFTRANAASSTQGGLLHIPLATTVTPGHAVTARITFTLTLGENSFDRFGKAGGYAWFGSGEPLLAWERGFGWHTEGMVDFPAESATSEAMDTSLTVTAPAGDTVIMSGDPVDPPKSGSTRTWHSTISTARDVSVAVGPFVVGDTSVNGVKLRLGAPDKATRDQLIPEFRRAITELVKRFGPYPFPSLSVARLPAQGGGIEYPSSILMLDGTRFVAVHETAHQWFYAMVGDSQALHPWLDEAFADYSEQLVDGDFESPALLTGRGPVDSSTESYGRDAQAYYSTTYDKGSAALEAARRAAGPAKFDAALRCYVARNAWRIADPADLAAALAGLPKAIAVLKEAGAIR